MLTLRERAGLCLVGHPPDKIMIDTTDLPIGVNSRTQTDDEFNVSIQKKMEQKVNRLQDASIDIAIRAKESREFLQWHLEHIRKEWADWIDQSNMVLKEIRMTRTAIQFEAKELLSSCGDVRKFFFCSDHEEQVSKLKEFVEVMERLQALKASGTLDSIADTILRLAVK